jgi:hypothetical protein
MSDAAALGLERLGGLLLLAACFIVPCIVFVLVRRRIKTWPGLRRGLATAGLSLGLVLASAAGLVFTVCAYPGAPGHGAKARAGYHRSAAVQHALDAYHAQTGVWPDDLAMLTPRWLADTVLTTAPVEWRYKLAPRGYELSFWYTGPGSNTCTFASETGRWQCSGLF